MALPVTVAASSGSAPRGAPVTPVGERLPTTAVTGEDGGCRLVCLSPGRYSVRADLEGFQSAEGVISVSAGGRAEVQLQLADVVNG